MGDPGPASNPSPPAIFVGARLFALENTSLLAPLNRAIWCLSTNFVDLPLAC